MAFDNPTRNRLQRLVSECRDLLTREFDAKLQELYGIYAGEGRVLDLQKLPHLDDEKLRVATLLRERIEHLASGGGGTPTAIGEAVKRVLREQAFTVLNRFAALRMAEERGIIVESVGGGLNSKGFKTFSEVAYSGLGTAYERYRVFLGCMFDEMAVDLGVLFDRQSPYGLLFPRENVLLELFERLNAPEIKPLWKEDETIGWIYQYFNDPAERKRMRDESAAPRNSRELAVRNQFFTPRYVVEFLTDNTLGRIWYEMTQGETQLKEQCRYLVRRPNEIFLKPGETAPEQPKQDNLVQEDLLKQPVHIPHRPLKDPRTILMLDPACGSMHFGIYAFDLFQVIYDEAWSLEEMLGADALSRPEGLKSLHDTYADKDAFLKDVPRLIIEHNLHGIDIDPRCVQMAGLSLWLRAQKAWKDMGLKPAERPAIKRSNIVCAEPMPGEKHLLREFVEREFQPTEQGVFLRLLEAIFDKMQLAGEAGALLKIEEEIRGAIEDAKAAWQKLHTRPAELFATAELNAVSRQPELDATADLRPITADFWETAEGRLLDALRHYAEQAENGGGFQRRLFAEDAAHGFAFIDICSKRYDVAVMNPPFGEWSAQYKVETKRAYPFSYNDILAAFVERGGLLLHPGGRIGAITSRTCFFLSSFTKWRDHVVLDRLQPELLVDLGHGVMDAAMVEAAAYVLHKPVSGSVSRLNLLCFRLLTDEEPAAPLASSVEALRAGRPAGNIFTADPVSFRQIPNAPFAYWVSERIRRLFAQLPSFEGEERKVKQGLATADDFRFIRAAWETTALAVGDSARVWFTFAKGGSYSPFYSDVFLMVNWGKGGAEIKNNLTERGTVRSNVWMLRDTELLYFLRPGLTWPRRTNGLSFRALPAGSIFADKGPVAFVADDSSDTLLGLLAIANSRPFALLISVQLARVELAQSFEVGLVQNTPVPQELSPELPRLARSAWSAKRRGDTANLTSHAFFLPALARGHASLASNLGGWSAVLAEDASSLADLRCQIDDIAYRLYSICGEDRIAIEHILGNPASATPSDADETSSPEDETEEGECAPSASAAAFVSELLDYGCGVAFGYWDIGYATGEKAAPELPDPFAPLPVCPPGQLQNAHGLPARPEDVPADYSIRIPWEGILVDDPNHLLDIERRVREVIEIIWSGSSGHESAHDSNSAIRNPQSAVTPEAIEAEACEILGVKSLRDYFRKPAGFFADHLKRYSKSRRQAPIYWPLSTCSGSYTLWIYYHRLTDQTLFQCVNDFVKPKITEVDGDLSRLSAAGADKPGARAEIERLTTLRAELVEFRDELLRVAQLPYKPNLNDGVLITASPLWKLFRLPKWQKDLKACWEALAGEKYEWAHLAYTLWPDRVKKVCKTDRSIAIAHGLEDLCEIKAPEKKAKRGKKRTDTELALEQD